MTTKPTPTVYSVRDCNCAKKYELPSETRRLNHETALINSSHSAYNTWSNHHLPDRSTCHVPFRSHLPSFYPYEYRVSRRSVFSWFSFLISKPQVILTIPVQLKRNHFRIIGCHTFSCYVSFLWTQRKSSLLCALYLQLILSFDSYFFIETTPLIWHNDWPNEVWTMRFQSTSIIRMVVSYFR